MSIKRRLIDGVNKLIGFIFDAAVVRKSDLDKLGDFFKPSFTKASLPKKAEEYLRPDNPRLKKLKKQYSSLNQQVTIPTLWTDKHIYDSLKLQYFRGDNVYVFQYRDMNTEEKHLLVTSYIRALDKLNLLSLLDEDNLFGIYTFKFDELTISRDLLDSITEIYFLEQALAWIIHKLPKKHFTKRI